MKGGPKADLVLKERFLFDDHLFAELVIWRVPVPLRGSSHEFKYRLALIEKGVCVLRFDNEAGKGDHMHIGDDEIAYSFRDLDALQADFWAEVERRLQP